MAPNDVFHKTARGSAEIAARSIKLAPMTRMAMVMIDGVKPFSDLCSKLGGEAAAQAAITELLGHGLVELPVPVGAPIGAPSAAAATATVPAVPTMPFDQLRRWATRAASQAMGPMGDDYCLGIERAKHPAELDAAVERARNGIDVTNSRAKAAAYWNEYVANRGG